MEVCSLFAITTLNIFAAPIPEQFRIVGNTFSSAWVLKQQLPIQTDETFRASSGVPISGDLGSDEMSLICLIRYENCQDKQADNMSRGYDADIGLFKVSKSN